jgi:hypothetical protein
LCAEGLAYEFGSGDHFSLKHRLGIRTATKCETQSTDLAPMSRRQLQRHRRRPTEFDRPTSSNFFSSPYIFDLWDWGIVSGVFTSSFSSSWFVHVRVMDRIPFPSSERVLICAHLELSHCIYILNLAVDTWLQKHGVLVFFVFLLLGTPTPLEEALLERI